MTTWADLLEEYKDMIRELNEHARLVNETDQSEDSDQDSKPTPKKTTTESKTTPDGIPVGVMFLPGRPKRKKS